MKKYDLDIEEDFVYSARQNKGSDNELDRLAIAKNWCEKLNNDGKLLFNPENSQRRYVRFTTPTLNALIPESPEKLSPWGTKNYYVYEITTFKGEFFIQLYFYCANLTNEMREAFTHLASIMNVGELTKGYKLLFKSSAFQNDDDDTAEKVVTQLDSLFTEVQAFEKEVLAKWDPAITE